MKKTYIVISCPKCQGYLLARHGRKTRQCPYCGGRVNLSNVDILWSTSDLEEARSVLQSKRQSRSQQLEDAAGDSRLSTRF